MSETIPSLFLRHTDNRDNIYLLTDLNICVHKELRKYNSSAALKKFMERENFDSICADEINAVKGISGSIGVKETRSIYPIFLDFNKDIYE